VADAVNRVHAFKTKVPYSYQLGDKCLGNVLRHMQKLTDYLVL